MNHYSLKPIRLALRPSRQLAGLLGVAGTAACAAILLLPALPWVKLMLAAVVAATTLYYVGHDALLRMPGSIVALEVTNNGALRCLSRNGLWLDVNVRGDSFVTPWLTVLNLTEPGKRLAKRAILLSDSGDANVFRSLRVWLRWGSQAFPGK